jgi:XTP/dITP diphosphohydrolase
MKKILIIATANEKKFAEIKRIIESGSDTWEPIMASRWKKPFTDFPPEDGKTFLENARIKSKAIAKKLKLWSLGEDSGLVVDALAGAPGVYSARYGGPQWNDENRYEYLLEQMQGKSIRNAFFQTVISLASPDGYEVENFSGKISGKISDKASGQGGFGYDPVFIPDGFQKTMAELTPEEKDSISHRGKALVKFIDFQPDPFAL